MFMQEVLLVDFNSNGHSKSRNEEDYLKSIFCECHGLQLEDVFRDRKTSSKLFITEENPWDV